jgi:hypothetical protein
MKKRGGAKKEGNCVESGMKIEIQGKASYINCRDPLFCTAGFY